MVDLRLTEEQATKVRQAIFQPIQLRDPEGRIIGWVEPELTPEALAELKRRVKSKGPWYTGEQVQRRLQSLQKEWDRLGGFDEAYLREFLRRLNEEDPGHMRPES